MLIEQYTGRLCGTGDGSSPDPASPEIAWAAAETAVGRGAAMTDRAVVDAEAAADQAGP